MSLGTGCPFRETRNDPPIMIQGSGQDHLSILVINVLPTVDAKIVHKPY